MWTLADNFEWLEGYFHKYGMFYIDRSDPELKRIPKASSVLYKQVGSVLCLKNNYECLFSSPEPKAHR